MILFKIGGFPLKKNPRLKQDVGIFNHQMKLHLLAAGGIIKILQQRMGMTSLPSSLFMNRLLVMNVCRRYSRHCGESFKFDVLLQAFRFHEMFGDRQDSSYANMARMFLRGRIQLPTSPMIRPFPINLQFARILAEIGHSYKCSDCTGLLARIMKRMDHPMDRTNEQRIIKFAKESLDNGSLDGVVAARECFNSFTLWSLDPQSREKIEETTMHSVFDDKIDSGAVLDLLSIRANSLYVGGQRNQMNNRSATQTVNSLVVFHGHPGGCTLAAMMMYNDSMLTPRLNDDQKKVLLDEAMRLLNSVKSIGHCSLQFEIVYEDVKEELAKIARAAWRREHM